MPSEVRNSEYWLKRAREARSQAETMMTPEAKRTMLEIAAVYHRLGLDAPDRILLDIEPHTDKPNERAPLSE